MLLLASALGCTANVPDDSLNTSAEYAKGGAKGKNLAELVVTPNPALAYQDEVEIQGCGMNADEPTDVVIQKPSGQQSFSTATDGSGCFTATWLVQEAGSYAVEAYQVRGEHNTVQVGAGSFNVVEPMASCGDGTCNSGEDCSSCAADCGVCGPVCGDAVCDSDEDCSGCTADCGACGDAHLAPDSILADCSEDVTAALNTWIASVPDGQDGAPSVLEFAPDGCYRIDDKLIVEDRKHLVFEGNSATFRAYGPGHSDRKQWQVYAGVDITFRDMTVEGVNHNVEDGAYIDQYEWQHNFDFWGTQGVLIEGVTGKYAWGDFVALEADYRACCGATGMPPVRNVVIRNSHFYGAGRMGISTNYVDGLVIENNTIDRVRWSSIDLEVEDVAWYIRNVTIRNNTIGDVWHHFIAASGYNAPVNDVTVDGNTMTVVPGTNSANIMVSAGTVRRSNWTIENNTLVTREFNMALTRTDSVIVRNNTLLSWNAGSVAVYGVESENGTVVQNTLDAARTGAGYDNIVSLDSLSSGWTICGNVLHGTPGSPTTC